MKITSKTPLMLSRGLIALSLVLNPYAIASLGRREEEPAERFYDPTQESLAALLAGSYINRQIERTISAGPIMLPQEPAGSVPVTQNGFNFPDYTPRGFSRIPYNPPVRIAPRINRSGIRSSELG